MKFILTIAAFVTLSIQPSLAEIPQKLNDARSQWIDAFNNQANDIHLKYFKLGGLYLNNQLYVDRGEIADQLANLNLTIQSVDVLHTLKDSKKRFFEIGSYNISGEVSGKLIYATIWLKVSSSGDGPQWVKEFDVLYPQSRENTDTASLDAAIKKWDKWVHKKSALQFTKRMYTDKAIYFAKRELFSGRSAIEKEYGSYVEYAGFYLRLSPTDKLIFQPGHAVDIGNYKTPWGRGKYVRFWQQQPDDSWKIVFEAD